MKGKKRVLIFILISLIVFVVVFIYFNNSKKIKQKQNEEHRIEKIKESYNKYVLTKKDCDLYDDNGKVIGFISENYYLELEDINEDYKNEFFKLKNIDAYIKYTDIKSAQEETQDDRYKNYILFNEDVVIPANTKIYYNDSYISLNKELEFPIIINDVDKYYFEFDDKLLYVLKDDVSTVEASNSDSEILEAVSVLNYHFVINIEAGEDKLCEPYSICHSDTQFDSHMNYIKENGFYTLTLEELEMFIDGKINLPKKSVVITIDDGWFVSRSIMILEKYDLMGTLFLIGSLAPVTDYASDNLEIHSHTWNLHNVSNCSEGRSPLLCYDNDTLVNDLKMSRESLNDTTYFCYPFYEYNNHAINALKEAGFTMALTDGNVKVKRNIDKFKVPRYVIFNTTTVSELAKMIN